MWVLPTLGFELESWSDSLSDSLLCWGISQVAGEPFLPGAIATPPPRRPRVPGWHRAPLGLNVSFAPCSEVTGASRSPPHSLLRFSWCPYKNRYAFFLKTMPCVLTLKAALKKKKIDCTDRLRFFKTKLSWYFSFLTLSKELREYDGWRLLRKILF